MKVANRKSLSNFKNKCAGKIAHATFTSAEYVLNRMKTVEGEILEIYKCKFCKKFHIGQLIAVVEGSLVCTMDEVYDILNFMSGESLMTHALPRVAKECKPVLLEYFPWLAEIKFPGVPTPAPNYGFDAMAWITEVWLKPLAEKYGEYHDVFPLHSRHLHS